ncbi:MAG: hypothetical protein JWM88_2295 [Verrucomicrobia bacterium]|nr:hypothetical protein [Verrucomicrobiota bacterium]
MSAFTAFPRKGILVALAIPTDARGRVMRRALGTHVAWLRRQGIHGVLALGSTGEFVRFTLEERKAILETVAELAAPLPVIANISDIRLAVAQELGRFARRLKLAGVAIMPPSFFPLSAEDQLAFFERAAAAAQLPVMLYNFPELTGNRIAPGTVAAFAARAPLAGFKQSGSEFSYHRTLVRLGRELDFSVFSGADTRLPEVFQLGADGCIGGLVNIVPELMVEQFRVHHEGEPGSVEPTASRMREVGRVIGQLTFPLNVAAGLAARGFDLGRPKTVISKESARLYVKVARELRACFRRWKLETGGGADGREVFRRRDHLGDSASSARPFR